MSKKIHFVLSLGIALVFFSVAPLVVLRAQGYRFSVQEKKLITTGGIFLKSMPPKASIYLNSKLLKVQTPAIINGLMPGKYLVQIRLDGFYPWEKKLEVEPNMVVKQDRILLLPKKPKIVPVSELPAIIKTKEEKLNYNQHEIRLKSEDEQEETKLVTRYGRLIKQAFLYKDQKHVIFLVDDEVKVIEIDGMNTIDFIKADQIFYQNDQFYVFQNKNWFLVDLED